MCIYQTKSTVTPCCLQYFHTIYVINVKRSKSLPLIKQKSPTDLIPYQTLSVDLVRRNFCDSFSFFGNMSKKRRKQRFKKRISVF